MHIPFSSAFPNDDELQLLQALGFDISSIEREGAHYAFTVPNTCSIDYHQGLCVNFDLNQTYVMPFSGDVMVIPSNYDEICVISYNNQEVITIRRTPSSATGLAYHSYQFTIDAEMVRTALASKQTPSGTSNHLIVSIGDLSNGLLAGLSIPVNKNLFWEALPADTTIQTCPIGGEGHVAHHSNHHSFEEALPIGPNVQNQENGPNSDCYFPGQHTHLGADSIGANSNNTNEHHGENYPHHHSFHH